jgi:hypothetical protein
VEKIDVSNRIGPQSYLPNNTPTQPSILKWSFGYKENHRSLNKNPGPGQYMTRLIEPPVILFFIPELGGEKELQPGPAVQVAGEDEARSRGLRAGPE